tara:strand:- start:17074 stop:18351 length:1278 start_codon:yes stop_codon:yes gene_type:complete
MIEAYRNVLKEPKFILIAAYSFLMCFEYIFVEALGGDSIFKPYRIAGIILIAYAFLNACYLKKVKLDSYDFLIVLFFSIHFFSAFSTAGLDGSGMYYTNQNIILILLSFLVCFSIKQFLENDIKLIELIVFLFMLATFINVIYAIYSVISNPVSAFRISGFYKDPAIFGVTVSILITYCIAQYLYVENNTKLKIIIFIVSTLSFGVLLLAASRTGLLSLFLVVSVVGVMKLGFIRTLALLFIIIGSLIFVNNIDFTNFSPEIQYGIGRTFDRLSIENTLGGGGAGRLPTWRAAFLLFEDNYFFGIGMGQYPEYSIQYAQLLPEGVENSVVLEYNLGLHSNYLSALIEGGIIGFIVYATLNFLWLVNSIKAYTYLKDANSLFFLLFFILISLSGFTQETFQFPYYLFFLTMLTIYNRTILSGETKA